MKLSNHVEKVWNRGNQNGLKLPTFSYSGMHIAVVEDVG